MKDITLPIVQTGNPVLRAKARPLTKEEILSPATQQLIEQMKATMHKAPGVGLAAPQIGQSLQIIVIEDKKEYTYSVSAKDLEIRERAPVPFHVVINPILTITTDNECEFYEGCLSVAGFVGPVNRAHSVKVECLNEKAKATTLIAKGWYARILQHEVDHLNGVLCIDKMDIKNFTTLENYQQFVLQQ